MVVKYQITSLFDNVNQQLQEDRGKLPARGAPCWVKAWEIRLLDRAIKKGVVPHPLTVYRGCVLQTKDFKDGDIITENGYSSTSLSPSVAANFLSRDFSVFAEIRLPAGAHAAAPAALDLGFNDVDKEQELLLPRNSRFRVVKADAGTKKHKGGTYRKVILELILENKASAAVKPKVEARKAAAPVNARATAAAR